jgi:hypothetical protein
VHGDSSAALGRVHVWIKQGVRKPTAKGRVAEEEKGAQAGEVVAEAVGVKE